MDVVEPVVADDAAVGGFDHYARLVRRLLRVPIALVTLVEVDRQVFHGADGLDPELDAARETPLSHSVCQYVVADDAPLVIGDLVGDERLCDHPALASFDLAAYAGWPLTDHTGRTVGSLCALDHETRVWTEEEVAVLRDLAAACSVELAERERRLETARALTRAEDLGERSRALLALSTGLSATATLGDVAAAVVAVSTEQLGCQRAGVWLRATTMMTDGPARARLGEHLFFREAAPGQWLSARRFSDLPVDRSNPVGACLVVQDAVYFGDRAAQDRVHPHLVNPHQLGEARAFVPLVAGGRTYGTLALVWPGVRAFTGQDRATIAALASYTAQAVHRAVLLEDRIDAAVTLQTALLGRLPEAGGLQIAARYRPAGTREQVGGDWYDAFVAADGDPRLVIGDIAGHDVAAAAAMGQVRSMLRMAAWHSDGRPSADLGRLDDAMDHFDLEVTASVLLARLGDVRAGGRRPLWWSSAGHPPPVLVEPGESPRLLDAGPAGHGTLLGVDPGLARTDGEALLAPGSLLVLYTDGLVERRDRSIDDGLHGLVGTIGRLEGLHDLTPDEVLDRVLAEVGPVASSDDVALLAVRLRD